MIKHEDFSIAFSQDGANTITWKYSEDSYCTILLGQTMIYEYRQGKKYVQGSNASSYKNSWPVAILPPKHRYLCNHMLRFYEEHYETHPTPECQVDCYRCTLQYTNHQAFLYLLCISTAARIVYIPHLMKRRTVSPHI